MSLTTDHIRMLLAASNRNANTKRKFVARGGKSRGKCALVRACPGSGSTSLEFPLVLSSFGLWFITHVKI